MLNRIELIGNLGGQPEIRTVGDSKVASFSLGVTERGYTTKDGRKTEDRTIWFRVGAWKGLAEIIEKYVNKGDKIFVAGKMLSREYEKDNTRHTMWEVNASEIELLTPKRDNGNQTVRPNDTAPVPPPADTRYNDSDLPF